ncbi:MAG: 30S ribosomal protein S3 [Bacilli bacterium]|jgi:small subunit ribosomal protein S3
MGQKVNPVGLRIGINKNWNSRWYADRQEYAAFLGEDMIIRNYLQKNLKSALLSHIEIERAKTDKGHTVTAMCFVARPGVVIGQDGANINRIKKELAKKIKIGTIRIDIIEVKNPDLDAELVAQWIASELENRASFRTAQKKAIQRVRKAGAKGIKTEVSGRLGGNDIARSEGYKDGIVPLHTLRSDIDYAHVEAHTTYGRLGVKVWICRGEILPEEKKTVTEGE